MKSGIFNTGSIILKPRNTPATIAISVTGAMVSPAMENGLMVRKSGT